MFTVNAIILLNFVGLKSQVMVTIVKMTCVLIDVHTQFSNSPCAQPCMYPQNIIRLF